MAKLDPCVTARPQLASPSPSTGYSELGSSYSTSLVTIFGRALTWSMLPDKSDCLRPEEPSQCPYRVRRERASKKRRKIID